MKNNIGGTRMNIEPNTPLPWVKQVLGDTASKGEWRAAMLWQTQLINNIQDALGTAETGEALVEVARNAHRAEQRLAQIELQLSKSGLFDLETLRRVLKEEINATSLP